MSLIRRTVTVRPMRFPVTFLVFGATGDLAEKKLFPALFGLYRKKLLPLHFKVVGFARRPFTDESFRELIKPALKKAHADASDADLTFFLSRVTYHQGQFDDVKTYISLINRLGDIDKELGACSHKIFHLAILPKQYEIVLKNLEASALNLSCTDGTGYTRVLIEKPIGDSLKTAQKINGLLNEIYKEDQIFRVDHYVMKQALTDLLTLRFSAPDLADVWNKEWIEQISLRLYEKNTVEGRGAFYDQLGAFRDVGQNHLLEMLALLIERAPSVSEERKRGSERAEALAHVAPPKTADMCKKAQYSGYLQEEGVAENSHTETYFKVPVTVSDPAWEGVPFVLESGKALAESCVEVTIQFKKAATLSFGKSKKIEVLKLTFHVQPKAAVICHDASGKEHVIPYGEIFSYSEPMPDNYEKVYYDSLHNDQTWFVSKEEVEASWRVTDPLLQIVKKAPLSLYEPDVRPEDIF